MSSHEINTIGVLRALTGTLGCDSWCCRSSCQGCKEHLFRNSLFLLAKIGLLLLHLLQLLCILFFQQTLLLQFTCRFGG